MAITISKELSGYIKQKIIKRTIIIIKPVVDLHIDEEVRA